MRLELSDLDSQVDDGVYPTPDSLRTTPGTPGDIYSSSRRGMGERKDSGILTSPDGAMPSAPEDDRGWSQDFGARDSDFHDPEAGSESSFRTADSAGSEISDVKSDDTDLLIIQSTQSMEPVMSSDTDTRTLVSTPDSSSTTYIMAQLDQTLPGYRPPEDSPDSSSTPTLVGADSYGRLNYPSAERLQLARSTGDGTYSEMSTPTLLHTASVESRTTLVGSTTTGYTQVTPGTPGYSQGTPRSGATRLTPRGAESEDPRSLSVYTPGSATQVLPFIAQYASVRFCKLKSFFVMSLYRLDYVLLAKWCKGC